MKSLILDSLKLLCVCALLALMVYMMMDALGGTEPLNLATR